jgi:hypothetical protein
MSVPLTYLFQDAGRILCDKVFFAIAVTRKNFCLQELLDRFDRAAGVL